MEKGIYHASAHDRKSGVTSLVFDKVDLKEKGITKNKDGPYKKRCVCFKCESNPNGRRKHIFLKCR